MDTNGKASGSYRLVVLATDGSELSRGAERVAIGLAGLAGGTVCALRLILDGTGGDDDVDRHMEQLRQECEEVGAGCTLMVRPCRDPALGILSAVEDSAAEVLVMGRRGRRGLARFMVGDATARVLNKASCQVLVVPRASQLWGRGVLLATDGLNVDEDAVRAAIALARLSRLPLTLLSVTETQVNTSAGREVQAVVNRVAAKARQDGVSEVEGLVVEGEVDETIIGVARERGLDLIVGGVRERSGLARLLSTSTMERVIGQTSCPVLTVK